MDFPCIDQPWLLFKHPLVQELAFSIAGPPLLAHWPASLALESQALGLTSSIDLPDYNFWQEQFTRYLPRLQQLDANPQPLEQHLLGLRSTRLGIRFEHLLAFWLQDSAYHPFQLIGQGIKRMEGQRTIGEIDFLVLNQDTQQTEHWEVAIKFYLGEKILCTDDLQANQLLKEQLQANQWLGPNRRDSLVRKLKHVCQHQFNVADIHGHEIYQRRAIIKGRLFYPAGFPVAIADWTAPQHLTGFWGYDMPVAPQGFRWRYASRQEWMVADPNFHRISLERNTIQPSQPMYWRNGLYFLLDAENKVILHYMLRITDKMHKFLINHNTLKPNPNAADIFNQISII